MKRNPLIPFAIIGVIGIVLMLTMGGYGINKIHQASQDKEKAAMDPEAIFKQNCSSCHGQNLEGGTGPALDKIGGEYSEEEIADIVKNGKPGGMPAGVVKGEEAKIVVKWLAEKK
ncbi:cytochrome c [Fictibacillus nanhaiensis]|jgi:cytochrome c550|uniref:cytochrome c550 n=1 Tax=Fictibacillus nanhaiensis TaxID=742169 RepID=UPI0020407D57|nr:c-type cytochrome [Fictibacillus nanhaiensis]MCM3730732.1 cytochrome c [Fictibacillus nanhaiensis]